MNNEQSAEPPEECCFVEASLSEALLLLVLERLSGADLVSASEVCRRWRASLSAERRHLWRGLYARRYGVALPEPACWKRALLERALLVPWRVRRRRWQRLTHAVLPCPLFARPHARCRVALDPPFLLAAPGSSASLRLTDLRSTRLAHSSALLDAPAFPTELALSHPFAAATDGAHVYLWHLPSSLACAARLAVPGAAYALALRSDAAAQRPHQALLACACEAGSLRAWRLTARDGDALEAAQCATLRLQEDAPTALALWRGACLAFGTATGGVGVWCWADPGGGAESTDGRGVFWLRPPGGRGSGRVSALTPCACGEGEAGEETLLVVRAQGEGGSEEEHGAAERDGAQAVCAALRRLGARRMDAVSGVLRSGQDRAGGRSTHAVECYRTRGSLARALLAWRRDACVLIPASAQTATGAPRCSAARDAVGMALPDGTLFLLCPSSGTTLRRLPVGEESALPLGVRSINCTTDCFVWLGEPTCGEEQGASWLQGHAAQQGPVFLTATLSPMMLSVAAHSPAQAPALCACGNPVERVRERTGRSFLRCARTLPGPDGRRRCAFYEAFD